MAELEADPEFRAHREEQKQRHAERSAKRQAACKPILGDPRRMGVEVASIEEMTVRYAPLSPQIAEVLLRWLPVVAEDRVKESLIRALGAVKHPFDGQPLIDAFLADTSDETLRWPIANTMAEARPFGISDWLFEAVRNPRFGTARQMLVLAFARLVPQEISTPILHSLLDELPGPVAAAFAEVGGERERKSLQDRIENMDGWRKAEFLKAIRKITRRLKTNR